MVGSGVIPVALHKGKVYYLFGREGTMDRDKNFDWGDFGGGSKPGEDLLEITTREGCEVLNGFFGDKKDFKKWMRGIEVRDGLLYDKKGNLLEQKNYYTKYFNRNIKQPTINIGIQDI